MSILRRARARKKAVTRTLARRSLRTPPQVFASVKTNLIRAQRELHILLGQESRKIDMGDLGKEQRYRIHSFASDVLDLVENALRTLERRR
jgi:hypothetical protein